MNTKETLCRSAILSTLILGSLHAADWPGFLGPGGAGIAAGEATQPVQWSAEQNLAWKTELPGPGSSSPIVWGDRVFVTCYSGYGVDGDAGRPADLKRHLVCLDRRTGKTLWDRAVPATLPEDPYRGYLREHGYASSTPVTDGERVFVFFGKSGALAFDFEGETLWTVNLGQSSSNRQWGSAASPILYGDLLIVNASEEARAVIALDKCTGKEVWRADSRSLGLCFGTPVLVDQQGGRTDLVLAMPGELWGLNPENGEQRWYARTGITGNISPTVTAGNGMVFATGGYPRLGSTAIRSGGEGDVTESHVAWTSRTASYVPTPVFHEGRLFVVNEKGYALSLDAKNGDLLFKERLPDITGNGVVYASPVLANGRFYVVSRRHGVYVLDAGRAFNVVAHNLLAGDDSDFNATPAIVDGQIILRSNRALYCVAAVNSDTNPERESAKGDAAHVGTVVPEADGPAIDVDVDTEDNRHTEERPGMGMPPLHGPGGGPGHGPHGRREGPPGGRGAPDATFVRRLDKDGDGKVSWKEFDGPSEHFQVFDRDRDGYLTQTEAPPPPPPHFGRPHGSQDDAPHQHGDESSGRSRRL